MRYAPPWYDFLAKQTALLVLEIRFKRVSASKFSPVLFYAAQNSVRRVPHAKMRQTIIAKLQTAPSDYFNVTPTYRSDSSIHALSIAGYGSFVQRETGEEISENVESIVAKKEHLALQMVSNWRSLTHSHREKLVHEMQKFMNINFMESASIERVIRRVKRRTWEGGF